MRKDQFKINKGINRSIIFKGLKAQYIGYMGVALLADLAIYAVLYVFKVNTYITLIIMLSSGGLMTLFVYHLNARFGEKGLIKHLAKRKIPSHIRSVSRKVFQPKK